MLADGWLPHLLLIAPALKLLSICVYLRMPDTLPLLLYQPALQAVEIEIGTLISPYQLPLFLPWHCTIRELITTFPAGDVARGMPPAEILPRIISLVASTHEPHESSHTYLAPLSACSMLCSLTIYVLGPRCVGIQLVHPVRCFTSSRQAGAAWLLIPRKPCCVSTASLTSLEYTLKQMSQNCK